jgi:hypothetical protein
VGSRQYHPDHGANYPGFLDDTDETPVCSRRYHPDHGANYPGFLNDTDERTHELSSVSS